mmetsp:Transcript_2006/g.3050  ORF Transcript_2006/g.3050 Transcript_2006/m.3050 type:complete len:257 (-) Transcript_2006:1105-1875(-)
MKRIPRPSLILLLCCLNSSEAKRQYRTALHLTSLTSTSASTTTTSTMRGATTIPAAFALVPEIPTIVAQATSGLATYFGLVAYFDRPRGRLDVDASNIEAKQSQVEGAGLGLYACRDIPEGTILGTYPGVVRPADNYMVKTGKAPDAGVYAWRFTDNQSFIDPTDQNGQLLEYCFGGTDDFPLSYFLHGTILRWKVSTMLSRINEPPIGGGGCNVRSEENLKTREVVFELSRDVYAGEELFMDYGLTYDRTTYGDK